MSILPYYPSCQRDFNILRLSLEILRHHKDPRVGAHGHLAMISYDNERTPYTSPFDSTQIKELQDLGANIFVREEGQGLSNFKSSVAFLHSLRNVAPLLKDDDWMLRIDSDTLVMRTTLFDLVDQCAAKGYEAIVNEHFIPIPTRLGQFRSCSGGYFLIKGNIIKWIAGLSEAQIQSLKDPEIELRSQADDFILSWAVRMIRGSKTYAANNHPWWVCRGTPEDIFDGTDTDLVKLQAHLDLRRHLAHYQTTWTDRPESLLTAIPEYAGSLFHPDSTFKRCGEPSGPLYGTPTTREQIRERLIQLRKHRWN